MTNEEWLKSQPAEILVKYLTCKGCTREYYDEETDFCPSVCDELQLKWLKAERIENGN